MLLSWIWKPCGNTLCFLWFSILCTFAEGVVSEPETSGRTQIWNVSSLDSFEIGEATGTNVDVRTPESSSLDAIESSLRKWANESLELTPKNICFILGGELWLDEWLDGCYWSALRSEQTEGEGIRFERILRYASSASDGFTMLGVLTVQPEAFEEAGRRLSALLSEQLALSDYTVCLVSGGGSEKEQVERVDLGKKGYRGFAQW